MRERSPSIEKVLSLIAFNHDEKNLQFLLDHPNMIIDWNYLSCREWTLPLLMRYANKITNWKYLSRQDCALPLLLMNPDKDLDWDYLSWQKWALPLFEDPRCIRYAFVLAFGVRLKQNMYNCLRESRKDLHEDLIAYIHHPRFIEEHISFGFEVETYEYPRQHL